MRCRHAPGTMYNAANPDQAGALVARQISVVASISSEVRPRISRNISGSRDPGHVCPAPFETNMSDGRRLLRIAEVDPSEVTGELATDRLARQPERSGPSGGGVGHALVTAFRASAGERVDPVRAAMEGEHPQWVLEPRSGRRPQAGHSPDNLHGLGMERGESAGHPGPARHPRETYAPVRLRVSGEEPVDEGLEILDVSVEIPFKARPEWQPGCREGHHRARRAQPLHRAEPSLPLGRRPAPVQAKRDHRRRAQRLRQEEPTLATCDVEDLCPQCHSRCSQSHWLHTARTDD